MDIYYMCYYNFYFNYSNANNSHIQLLKGNYKNENIEEFNDNTYTCTYMIVNIANLIRPFLSETSDKILNMLDISKESNWLEKEITGNIKIVNNELLFNRIDDEETKSIMDKLNNKQFKIKSYKAKSKALVQNMLGIST